MFMRSNGAFESRNTATTSHREGLPLRARISSQLGSRGGVSTGAAQKLKNDSGNGPLGLPDEPLRMVLESASMIRVRRPLSLFRVLQLHQHEAVNTYYIVQHDRRELESV
jgi:hypothetical protein